MTWESEKLENIVDFETGKLNANAAKKDGKYPFFTCSQETFKIDKYAFDKEAILLSGNNAKGIYSVKYYNGKFNAYQRTYVIQIKNKNLVSYDFLLLALTLNLERLRIFSIGTSTKYLTLGILKNFEVTLPPLEEQQKIVGVLSLVQEAIRQQEQLISTTTELKKATMQKLFTEGTRGEPQKMTEIGLIPESWDVVKLGKFCKVKSSSLSFKKVSILGTTNKSFPRVLAIKVSDMNTESNQREINTANLEFYPDPSKFNFNKCISPGAIIFPKRGAAIATNKKRLLGEKAILDPNLIAVIPGQEFLPQFLYNYFLRIDLTKFTDPGCLPQLNKKDIEPADLPMPSIQEQEAITQIANLFDSKEGQHKIRLRTLQDLFQTLLHQLMTAQIRVDDLDLSALNLELQGGKQDALV